MSETEARTESTGMPVWLFGSLVGIVVVALGAATMLGLWWISGGDEDEAACSGQIELGFAPDITEKAASEPDPGFINGRCQWWYAIAIDGSLVAYKRTIEGRDCKVAWDYDDDLWRCGPDRVDESELEEWPSRIADVEDRRSMFIVDFGNP